MFMKKSGNLLFQTEAPPGIAHGCRVVEEVSLYFSGEIVPLKDNRSAQTPQNTLFELPEAPYPVRVPILVRVP